MRERRWLLLAVYGLLLATAVSAALKATRPKFKIATTSTTTSTTEEPNGTETEDGEVETTTSGDVNATTARVLTGIPQIDYIWDPNLPRELNGYNLSEYPFYNSIPEEIDFKCDGLHDGFYASVIHKCQVYHHCLYGTRYDFLCANFTAFDQRTFICHFASEVDCANSKKYWHRNDALYKAAETTTLSTTSTSTTTVSTTTTTGQPVPGPRPGARRRRPYRRRPAYDYYDEDYYDEEAYERTRPRGYERPRDDYDYDDRKYPRRDRDRDRNFRDRDYRDREIPRAREPDRSVKEELPPSPRERFPMRNNRRDPVRPGSPRDPILEDEPRNRNRDQDPPSRIRDPEDSEDRRPLDSRNREVDDRRYSDKGYVDDYEDEPAPSGPASASGVSDVLVKPAAPPSSVYSRPRAPPKIRRPVPITEQEKFAYKATPAPPSAPVEARRRPVDTPLEDDYYEDELEEVRPRRPTTRRRPGFRDFYENPRERDRPFSRPRYREEGDEVRPRKYPERNRERYYERGPERGRDRSLDRTKDRGGERIPEANRERPGRIQETDRPSSGRPLEREHDPDRPRSSLRSKEPVESPETTKRPNVFERTSTTPATSTEAPKESSQDHRDRQEDSGGKNIKSELHRPSDVQEPETERLPARYENDSRDEEKNKPKTETEEYSSLDDEYDDSEYNPPPPPPPPRTAVRIVKRPFLPSRGGNPNPRGLSPVGSKVPESSRKEETNRSSFVKSQGPSDGYRVTESRENISDNREKSNDDRRPYDAYKSIQKDLEQKTRSDDYEEVISRPAPRRPEAHREIPISGHSPNGQVREDPKPRIQDENSRVQSSRISSGSGKYEEENNRSREKSAQKWNNEDYRGDQRGEPRREQENRGKTRYTENSGYYEAYGNDNGDQQAILQSENGGTSKQTLNEVVTHHRLQDIPESEYDVTLNEALTPSFNAQETNLPSGFVLPIHRQLGRDPVLQSTENSYKISRPYNQQLPSQSQQQKPFVPSPQFVSLSSGIGATSSDRSRSVQYFRTPEAVHVTGPQYRHHRGPWHDYTGY